MNTPRDENNCELCNRWKWRTFHHLIPRTCHRNKWFKKHFSLDKMKKSGIMLCEDCHSYLQEIHTEKELGRDFNTIEAIRADEKILKYTQWVRKKK